MEENKEGFEINYKLTYHSERQKRVWDSLVYGHQRIDILIIALSSAGIYVCLETLKYLFERNLCVNPLIKISAFVLLLTIFLNLISQWYSTKIHFNDYEICEYCITLNEEDVKECYEEINKREKIINKYEKLANYATNVSFLLLVIGLLNLLIFFTFIF